MNTPSQSAGGLLQEWRRRRRLSQLELASTAEISQRHLSFIESGRSSPSRDMVLHLAENLRIPMRERNVLLVAAGYAPVYPDKPLDDPALETARNAVDLILKAHEPYPALAVDRHWNLIASNRAVAFFLEGADAELLAPPVNVLRLSLHPRGLASRIANFRQWRSHIIARLAQQIDNSGDGGLVALLEDLKSYPAPANARPHRPARNDPLGGIATPFELITDQGGVLSFLSTTTIFGTAVDISLSELAIETFLPANPETFETMRHLFKAKEGWIG
jgi:transcriptional regulator with XRE-family HTH domain